MNAFALSGSIHKNKIDIPRLKNMINDGGVGVKEWNPLGIWNYTPKIIKTVVIILVWESKRIHMQGLESTHSGT